MIMSNYKLYEDISLIKNIFLTTINNHGKILAAENILSTGHRIFEIRL
jgi:hypothetical protein